MARTNAKAKGKGKGKKPADGSFGINLPEMFFGSLEAFFKWPFQMLVAGIVTMGTLAGSLLAVQEVLDGDTGYRRTLAYLVAMTIVGTIALPWYYYALALAEGKRISWGAPFARPLAFVGQAVCSFWMWAAIILGFRYLFGIPAALALVFYAFYGYLLADGATDRGLVALGRSVQLGQGRRLGLVMIAGLLSIFFLLGASTMGMEEWEIPAKVAGAILGTAVTGSIILVSGAKIYLVLEEDL